jgi:hypothetical protein
MLAKSALVLVALAGGARPVVADDATSAPADVAAFPAAAIGPERPPGFELHGAIIPWWTPWSQREDASAWRFRLAVLRFDARPAPGLSVIARLGFHVEGSPLLDLAATHYPIPALGLTFGQFRMPLGAAATTLGPQLVMLDRPAYVNAMTKQTFRDLGVMLHGPVAGQAGVHYRVAFASGAGRVGAGDVRPPDAHQGLVVGRAMFEHRAANSRVLVGATGAYSRDPATDDPIAVAGVLGRTLAPFDHARTTLLAGGDATLALGPLWLQAELMYLRARATDGSLTRRAFGASLELGWTLPRRLADHALQLAVRGERFDPDRALASDERDLFVAGLNVSRGRLRWSAFGTFGASAEITFRAVASF